MKIKIFLGISIIVSLILISSGCSKNDSKTSTDKYVSLEKTLKVKINMRKYEVKELLGKPDKVINDQDAIFDNITKDYDRIEDSLKTIGYLMDDSDKEKMDKKLVNLKTVQYSLDEGYEIQQLQYKSKDKSSDKKTRIINYYFYKNGLSATSNPKIQAE